MSISAAISPAIEDASASVAYAADLLKEAEKALAVAKADRDAIGTRIATLENEIVAISAKRRAGNGDDGPDGARLALINLDLGDLRDMKAEADQAVAPHQQNADAARNALAFAQQRLESEKQDELLRRVLGRADQLATQLFATIGEIEGHKKRLATSRDLWHPSPELANVIRRIDLGARGLT